MHALTHTYTHCFSSRLEEYEDLLRASEQDNQRIRNDSQKLLKTSVVSSKEMIFLYRHHVSCFQSKVRRESETQVMELRSQLENATGKIAQLESTQVGLKAQILGFEEVGRRVWQRTQCKPESNCGLQK